MIGAIITFSIALAILLIVLKILGKSIKLLSTLLINSIVGAIVLSILHIFVPGIEFSWLAALVVGCLGIPGVILVVVLQLFIL